MNLLIDYETYGQTAQMTHDFFRVFSQNTGCGLQAKNSLSIKTEDIKWADIILAIRPMNPISEWIARECKKTNKVHIVMYDDNLLNHLRTDRYMKKRQRYMTDIIKNSQVLLTTNELLTKLLLKFNRSIRTAHIDTVVEKDELKPLPSETRSSKDLKIVYYSNDGTTRYFDSFMPEVIKLLKDRLHQVEISIDLIGVRFIESNLGDCKVKFIPHMGYTDFKAYLRNGNYTVGISPIVIGDNFSKYKYFNKFIEYTMAGIVGIYTNSEPYIFEVENGYNGFLCNNGSDQWVENIIKIYSNPSLKLQILQNAYSTIEKKHSFLSVMNKLVEDIPELKYHTSSHDNMSSMVLIKLRYRLFWTGEKLNATLRYLKNGGIKAFYNRTRGYISTMYQVSKERKRGE